MGSTMEYEQELGLEAPCPVCEGTGTITETGTDCDGNPEPVAAQCWRCEGRGCIPSERGYEMLEFLRRHGGGE